MTTPLPYFMTDIWCRAMLRSGYRLALGSPDPSTQNGSFVFDIDGRMVGKGCNEFTRGMPVTPDLLERPKKYAYIEHAERNSLFHALSRGQSRPHVMVCPWAACADCARAIVQSGVRYLVRHAAEGTDNHTWQASIADGDAIMEAAEIHIITVTGPLGECAPVLRNGELLTP